MKSQYAVCQEENLMPVVVNEIVQKDFEVEIQARIDAERARLRAEAGLARMREFKKPVERTFTAAERDIVTILFGGLTWKHEAMIKAVFHGSGYRCENIPTPVVADFQAGKEFGNNGQCNPTYFTVGNLVRYLQMLEQQGLTRQQIIDNYVFFTAGSCGPCRFGMYEAEYRFALKNSGFEGFRVLLFQQTDGIKAASGEPGLKFSVDFGMGMLNALNLGDVINELAYQVRPFEVTKGETDRVMQESVKTLTDTLRDRKRWHIKDAAPKWALPYLESHDKFAGISCTLGKVAHNLYGKEYVDALHACRDSIDAIEVDRFRVKPVIKITGEFWAQTTEGDGNFNMFAFLEREGAQVLVEPIATWIAYMMYVAKEGARARAEAEAPYRDPKWYEVKKHFANDFKLFKKTAGLSAGGAMWTYFYHRTIKHMGDTSHHLVPQKELSRLAHPFYHQLARGGEGYMEVGKNVYYTVNHLCHMVLALKPFGCMPSTQSDGVQSRVVNKYKDMIFLPVETSGEGEVNAHSRVQMALAEAKAKARAEFDSVLARTGKSLDDLRNYAAEHPELNHALYKVPHQAGVAGTAAQFAGHVSDLMDRDKGYRRRSRASLTAAQVGNA
jgi:predicted nucleotide-binding protein (sugar kinase/HSP70/actin superfamily)